MPQDAPLAKPQAYETKEERERDRVDHEPEFTSVITIWAGKRAVVKTTKIALHLFFMVVLLITDVLGVETLGDLAELGVFRFGAERLRSTELRKRSPVERRWSTEELPMSPVEERRRSVERR